MGTSRIVFEEGFSQPLFKEVDFSDIDWSTHSLTTGTTYKVSENDMLYEKEIKPKHYVPNSTNRELAEKVERWSGKSYDGKITIQGSDDEENYTFILNFRNGHLIEIKKT